MCTSGLAPHRPNFCWQDGVRDAYDTRGKRERCTNDEVISNDGIGGVWRFLYVEQFVIKGVQPFFFLIAR